jgi:flagellar L-ring protein precursor FlgH
MKNVCSILYLWIFLIGMDAAYAQFSQNSSRSLFSDVKAFQEGDALMVLIMEDTRADNNASTAENRSNNLKATASAGSGDNSFDANAGVEMGYDFKGKGQTTRKETIRSRLSARVLEVDENGNLRIQGTRTTTINGETQTIVITGYVRTVDVKPDNSVYSYNILDLTLSITGDGSVTNVQEPGLVTRFLRWLF